MGLEPLQSLVHQPDISLPRDPELALLYAFCENLAGFYLDTGVDQVMQVADS